MKLKEYVYMLGIKPAAKKYGYTVNTFELPEYGTVDYAQWLHPREKPKAIEIGPVQELKKFIKPGDLCIDIGAHSGDTALPMGLAAGPEGKVLAFEPNSYVFPVLNKNATLNRDKTHIVPIMLAAGTDDEDMVFEYSDPGFCNGGHHENIDKWQHGHAFELTVTSTNALDYLQKRYADDLPKLSYIKTDAEGFDLAILQNLAPLIEEYRPVIMSEIFKHTSAEYRDGMFAFFNDRNYSITRVNSETNLQGEPLKQEDLHATRHLDIICFPQ